MSSEEQSPVVSTLNTRWSGSNLSSSIWEVTSLIAMSLVMMMQDCGGSLAPLRCLKENQVVDNYLGVRFSSVVLSGCLVLYLPGNIYALALLK